MLKEEMRADPSHKIILFLPTARQTQFVAEALAAAGIKALEIHSRKSQGHRTKTSDQFRAAKCAVMVSSDVSARGVDYPDVTLVVQVTTHTHTHTHTYKLYPRHYIGNRRCSREH